MSNFVIELKPSPELVELFNGLLAALRPETVSFTQSARPMTPAPLPPVTGQPQSAAPQSPTPGRVQNPAPAQYPAPPRQYQAPIPPAYTYPQAPANPTQPAPVRTTGQPVAPVTTYAAPTATPGNPAPQSAAPTAPAPAYSLDDLARAASTLMDAGKQQQLMGLLGQFNIQRLDALPKEQYGAFATALRQMGAQI